MPDLGNPAMPTAAFTLIGHLLCPDEQRAAIVLLEKAAAPPTTPCLFRRTCNALAPGWPRRHGAEITIDGTPSHLAHHRPNNDEWSTTSRRPRCAMPFHPSYSKSTMSRTPSTRNRLAILSAMKATLTASMAMASLATYAQPQGESVNARETGLTRAEVRADLALWLQAGLDQHEALTHSYGFETLALSAARAEYLRLRKGDPSQTGVRNPPAD